MGNLKKIFASVVLFCMSVSVSVTGVCAAEQGDRIPRPEELLGRMRKALDALGPAQFAFEFRAGNQAGEELGEEAGTFTAQGECFRLEGSVLTVYCDGVTKWIYDRDAQEITIFPHDTASTDPAENPFAVLRKADPEDYSFRGAVRKVDAADGQAAWLMVMAPKDRNAAYTLIEFTVSRQTMLPVAVSYRSRNGDIYDLKILSVRGLGALSRSDFIPPEILTGNPDIYITDLR